MKQSKFVWIFSGKIALRLATFLALIGIWSVNIAAQAESAVQSANVAQSATSFSFPSWMIEQSDKFAETLKTQSASLTPQDITRSHQRVAEAKQKNNWSVVAAETSRLLAKDPANRAAWLQLSLAKQNQRLTEDNWRLLDEAKYAAIAAFQLAKTNEEKVESLLVYGNSLDPENTYETPSYQEIFQVIRDLTNLETFRKEHKDFAALMPFQYSKMELNNQIIPPNVCFYFTQPLSSQVFNRAVTDKTAAAEKNKNPVIFYQDYLRITPSGDYSIKVTGRELCISPLQFGNNYDVIFKPGLPNEWGEKTQFESKVSFKVKDQSSRLSFSPKAYVLLREEEPKVPLSSVNVDSVKIKVLRINDRGLNEIGGDDYSGFLKPIWEYRLDEIQKELGELLYEGELAMGGEKNKTLTKQIPFSQIVPTIKPGIYIIYAEEKNALFGEKASASQWLIISDLGLSTFTESEGGIAVNVRSIKTGGALSDVELQLLAHNNSILGKVKTDKNGMGYFDASIARGKGGNRPLWVLAYGKKDDFSLIDLEHPAFDLSDRGVQGRNTPGPLDAFLYTEQGVYRPLETAHINTLLRDDKANAVAGLPLTFKILRPDEVEVARHVLTGTNVGFYELAFPLSGAARTGQWTVLAYADINKEPIGRANFSVEDFVPSRILVQLKADKPYLTLNQEAQVSVDAKYLFGAKASGLTGTATMTLRVRNNPYPEFPGYSFGLMNETFMDIRNNLTLTPLDEEGHSLLPITIDKAPKTTKPLEAVIKVTLSDKGGRPEIGTLKLPVFVKPFMIGIKPQFSEGVIPEGEDEAKFDVISLTPEGKQSAENQLEYEFYQLDVYYTWYQSDKSKPWAYQAQYEDKFIGKGTVSTKADGPVSISVPVKDWNQYRLDIRDPKTGAASSFQFSKGWVAISKGGETPDRLKIKVDKEKVKPGDKVSVMIEAPFEGKALVTIANSKILENRMIDVSPKGNKFKIEAKSDWGTGVYCLVSAARPLSSESAVKAYLPKRAVGIAWIGIDPDLRSLAVTLKPPAEVRPNQTIQIPIEVKNKDSSGTPSSAFVTVAAVDEGILKLTDFKTPSPQNYFLGQQQLGVEFRDLYGKLIDPLPGPMGVLRSGGDAAMLSRNMQALSKRSFRIVSLYKGLIPLDKQGKGTVSLDLPDFNGSLRLMAVAFDEKRVGSQDSSFLVRDPVVVEGVLPRFLAPEDESTFSLLLNNVAEDSSKFNISVESSGDVAIAGQKQFEVDLPKGRNHQLSIPIKAHKMGSGKVTVVLQGKDLKITRDFEISVRSPIAFVHRTQSQWLKPGETEQLKSDSLVSDFIPGTVEAFISWSSILPWDIQSLYRSLKQYPYGCVEQITSRAIASLLNGNKEDHRVVNQALALLAEKQNADGSFSLWSSSTGTADPWLTAYVVDFLLRAKAREYDVPKFALENALNWLSRYVQSSNDGKLSTLMNDSYALYLLAKVDRIEAGSIRYFYDSFYDKLLNPLSRAMLANSLVVKGDTQRAMAAFQGIFNLKAKEHTVPYGSTTSETAGILLLLQESLQEDPNLQLTSMIDSLKADLGNHLKDIQQLSTQEQAWVLMASYALVSTSPSLPWVVNVDDKALTANKGFVSLTLNDKLDKLQTGLLVHNPSQQTLWQSLDVTGIPKEAPSESNGFEIERHYYNLQGEEVVVEFDHERMSSINQGTELIVVLSGHSVDKLPHQVLILDLLPAGFEIENANLGQGSVSSLSSFNWLGNLTTADHTELRDDRYLAFVKLSAKHPEFRLAYQVRAITPGKYSHPGLVIEDMYAPQFRARTKGGSVQIATQSSQ